MLGFFFFFVYMLATIILDSLPHSTLRLSVSFSFDSTSAGRGPLPKSPIVATKVKSLSVSIT